jgi:phospholipase C
MKRFGLVCLFAMFGVAGCNGSSTVSSPPPTAHATHSIQHIVILLQENRSFNNLFAGFPGATTAMQGPCKAAPRVRCKTAHEVTLTALPLAQGPSTSGGTDICHSHQCFELECDFNTQTRQCRNDGFDLIDFGEFQGGSAAKTYPYAYVRRSDVKAYWDFARQYAIADRMFFTDTASSFVAHQMILSGTVQLNDHESLTDQPPIPIWGCDSPRPNRIPVLFKDGIYSQYGPEPCLDVYGSIADLLDAAKVSWKYYIFNLPQHGSEFAGNVWNGFDVFKDVRYGPDWKNITTPNGKIFRDLNKGTLPAMSWVVPTLFDSDHPASGCNGGPRWVTSVVNAIGRSRYWNNTAVILLWDDWGGWYDPVLPPQTNYTSLGFRVPLIVISPYAKAHLVSHTQYEFGSILKFIEQTFNLGSLHTTDVNAASLSDMFDFTQAPRPYQAEPTPHAKSCGQSPAMETILKNDRGIPD